MMRILYATKEEHCWVLDICGDDSYTLYAHNATEFLEQSKGLRIGDDETRDLIAKACQQSGDKLVCKSGLERVKAYDEKQRRTFLK